jgi:hypothetical protein
MTSGYEWNFAGTKKSIAHAFGVLPKYSLFAVVGIHFALGAGRSLFSHRPLRVFLHIMVPTGLASLPMLGRLVWLPLGR